MKTKTGKNAHGVDVIASVACRRPDGSTVELPPDVAAVCLKKPGWSAVGAEPTKAPASAPAPKAEQKAEKADKAEK